MTTVREVLLVRHAEAHCNIAGVIAGASCQGLTPIGRHQADQLARRLMVEHSAGRPLVRLYTSPTRRALQTASAISALTGVQSKVQQDLRVPDPGPVDGQPWEVVRRRFGPDPDRPSRPLIDGGEPWQDYLARAQTCLADVFNYHPGGRIVIIGHSETVTAALTWLASVPALGALRVDLHYTAITRLTAARERPNVHVQVQRWALKVHNDSEHLYHRFGTTQDYAT